MQLLVALDSFKGSLNCVAATAAVSRGLRRAWPQTTVRELPLADGGEGTLAAILAARAGRVHRAVVSDPLGRPVPAEWVRLGNTAVVELAQAVGLTLLTPGELNPGITTTYGAGQLIDEALQAGCSRIILGVGGSATVDGGAGLLQALGCRLMDRSGQPVPGGGLGLEHLYRVDATSLRQRLGKVELCVACDVENPLLGPQGAAWVFGPQKGADAALCQRLDEALAHYARCLTQALDLRSNLLDLPRGGAAGGTAWGLAATAGARLLSGAGVVMELTGFSQEATRCSVIIVGEGRVDGQTLEGKVVSAVLEAVPDRPVVIVAGQLAPGSEALYARGARAMLAVTDGPMSLEQAMAQAEPLLEAAGERVGRLLALGWQLAGEAGGVIGRETAAGGIVYRRSGHDYQVLMILDQYGHWTWPKGLLEPGESLVQAAVREVREETGIVARIETPLTEHRYRYTRRDQRVDKCVHLFLMQWQDGHPAPQWTEIQQAEWVTLDQAAQRLSYPHAHEVLALARRRLERDGE